jgi:hypothetical protein
MEIVIQVQKCPELFKAAQAGELEFRCPASKGDTANEFLQLSYDPKAGAVKLARFRNAQFDALYT